jgi:hypothetical protein
MFNLKYVKVIVYALCFTEYAMLEVEAAPVQADAFDANGPRLMITHIVNDNFKSYAGTQTLGPFHKVITPSYVHTFKYLTNFNPFQISFRLLLQNILLSHCTTKLS